MSVKQATSFKKQGIDYRGFAKRALLVIGVGLLSAGPAWADDGEDNDERYGDRRELTKKQNCKALRKARFQDPIHIATAKLYIEYNATDADLGVHGAFDDTGWSTLCVYDPRGKKVLAVKPKRQLKKLSMAGIFFESREPPLAEFSFADLVRQFPAGQYQVRGLSYDGRGIVGAATFSHAVPAQPTITHPLEDAVVSPADLVISWEAVTQTVEGKPLTVTAYEVIITKDVDDDPNGFSRPTFDVHVPPDRNTLAVPAEFLEPGTRYELEILALEETGNQTISVSFFETE